MENPFVKLLEQLSQGEIEEFVVTRDEFITFREAWLLRDDRTSFVGEAGLEGRIIYRYAK